MKRLLIIFILHIYILINYASASQEQTNSIAKISSVLLEKDQANFNELIKLYINLESKLKFLKIENITRDEIYFETVNNKNTKELNYYNKYYSVFNLSNKEQIKVSADFEKTLLIKLNEEEKKWLKKNDIRLSIDNNFPPYTFIADGEHQGLGIDFINLIEKKIGKEITLEVSNWDDALKKAYSNKVDGIVNINSALNQDKKLLFTNPYINVPLTLVSNKKENNIEKLDELEDKIILIQEGSSETDYFIEKYSNLNIKKVKDYQTAFAMVSTGNAFAVMGYNPIIENELSINTLSNLKKNFIFFDKCFSEQGLGVNKNLPILHSILNKAIESTSLKERQELLNKWLNTNEDDNVLSHSELIWLKKNKSITLANLENYYPYGFIENNVVKGFHSDLAKEMSENLNINIELKPYPTWEGAYNSVLNKETHGIFSLSWLKEREKHFIFSPQYYVNPYYFISNINDTRVKGIKDLSGKKVAIEKGIAISKMLKEKGSNIELVIVKNDAEAYKLLENKEVDVAFILNTRIKNFKNKYRIAFEYFDQTSNLHIGMNKENPIAYSIIKKAVNSLSFEESEKIQAKWFKQKEIIIDLSEKEKDWIMNNPLIKVIEFFDEPPFTINGYQKSGFNYELIEYLAHISGLQVEYKKGYKSYQSMFKSLDKNDVDILPTISTQYPIPNHLKIKKLTETFKTPFVVISKKDRPINSVEDLNGKKVAVIKDFQEDKHLDKFPNIKKVYVKDTDHAFKLLRNGKVDYYIGNEANSIYKINKLFKEDLKIAYHLPKKDFPSLAMTFAVNDNKKMLVSILEKAYEQMGEEKIEELKNKWLRDKNKHIELTNEEKNYIKANPSIKIANESNWAPFNFNEFGEEKGYSIELIKLIAEKTGLKTEFISKLDWNSSLELVKKNEMDIILNIAKTDERLEYLSFTEPILNLASGIIHHKDTENIHNFEDFKDKIIAVEKGTLQDIYLRKTYPDMHIEAFADSTELLRAVSYGNVDVAVAYLPTMEYLAEKNLIKNLSFDIWNRKESIFESIDLRIATNKKNEKLISIIRKGLKSIPQNEILDLKKRWLKRIEDKNHIYLLKKEKDWIKKNQNIKLGIYPDYLPYEAIGITSDFVNIIKEQTGLNIEVLPSNNWKNYSNNMDIENANLIVHIGDTYKNEFITTTPFIEDNIVIFTNKNKKLSIQDLKNKKVAIIKGFDYTKKLQKENPTIYFKEVDFKKGDELFNELSKGNYDAIISSVSYGKKKIKNNNLYNIYISGTTDKKINLSFSAKKKWETLVNILNKVIINIPLEKAKEIKNYWIKYDIDRDEKVQFEEKEKEYIKKADPIRFVYENNWKPFEWKNDLDEFTGINSDLLSIISKVSGLTFEKVDSKTWTEAIKKVKEGDADLILGHAYKKEAEKDFKFTSNNLYKIPYVSVTRKGYSIDFYDSKKILESKNFAVVKDFSIDYKLSELKYKDYKTVKSIKDGLKKLKNKEIDVFIMNQVTARYHLEYMGYEDLIISSNLNLSIDFKLAMNKNLAPELLSILDKSLKTISEEKRSDIYFKWTEKYIQSMIDWEFIYKMIFGVFVVFMAIMYWNRKLKKLVDEKTLAMQKLLQSLEVQVDERTKDLKDSESKFSTLYESAPDSVFIIKDQLFIDCNKMALKMFGIKDKGVLKSLPLLALSNEYQDNNELATNLIVNYVKEINEKGYIRFEWLSKRFDNNKIFDTEVISTLVTLNNEKCIYTIIRDISDRKKLERIIYKNQERLDFVSNHAKLAYWIKDIDTNEVHINDVFVKMLGYTNDDIIEDGYNDELFKPVKESQIFIKNLLHPHDYEKVNTELNNHLEGKQELFKVECRLKKKNGSWLWVKSIGRISDYDEQNRPLRFSAVNIDIQEAKEKEDKIQEILQQKQSSIEYASIIQHSLIPKETKFTNYFDDYFTIWQPKDTVGGDVYLLHGIRDNENECLLMVIDCTGHGVPGAFVTMLVKAIHREIITMINRNKDRDVSPAWILNYFNKTLKKILTDENSNVGFDGGILYYNKKENIIRYSGANIPLIHTKNNEIEILKGDRKSIGDKKTTIYYEFNEYTFKVNKGDIVYLSSDGYVDQIGGEKEFPFGKKNFIKILNENKNLSFENQKEILLNKLQNHQLKQQRTDDITIIGVKF